MISRDHALQYTINSVVYFQKLNPNIWSAVHCCHCCLLSEMISRKQMCRTLLKVLFTFRNHIKGTGVQYIIGSVVYFQKQYPGSRCAVSTFLVVFFTFRNDIQRAGVQYIIDSVVESLLKDPSRRLNFKTLNSFEIFIYKAGYIGLTVYHGQRNI